MVVSGSRVGPAGPARAAGPASTLRRPRDGRAGHGRRSCGDRVLARTATRPLAGDDDSLDEELTAPDAPRLGTARWRPRGRRPGPGTCGTATSRTRRRPGSRRTTSRRRSLDTGCRRLRVAACSFRSWSALRLHRVSPPSRRPATVVASAPGSVWPVGPRSGAGLFSSVLSCFISVVLLPAGWCGRNRALLSAKRVSGQTERPRIPDVGFRGLGEGLLAGGLDRWFSEGTEREILGGGAEAADVERRNRGIGDHTGGDGRGHSGPLDPSTAACEEDDGRPRGTRNGRGTCESRRSSS